MYRLWLHGLYGLLYGPRCPLSPKRPINLISLSLELIHKPLQTLVLLQCYTKSLIYTWNDKDEFEDVLPVWHYERNDTRGTTRQTCNMRPWELCTWSRNKSLSVVHPKKYVRPPSVLSIYVCTLWFGTGQILVHVNFWYRSILLTTLKVIWLPPIGAFYQHGLTGILVCISNLIHYFPSDVIIHPCPNSSGSSKCHWIQGMDE